MCLMQELKESLAQFGKQVMGWHKTTCILLPSSNSLVGFGLSSKVSPGSNSCCSFAPKICISMPDSKAKVCNQELTQ